MTEPAKVDIFCYALAAQGKRLFELEQMLFSLDPGFMAVLEQPQALLFQTNQILTDLNSMTQVQPSSIAPAVPPVSLYPQLFGWNPRHSPSRGMTENPKHASLDSVLINL